MTRDTNIQTMKEKAAAVQTIVVEIDDLVDAFRYTVDVTKRKNGSTIAAPGLHEPHRTVLRELCRENGLQLLTEDLREHLGAIHTGFTIAEWGIAETATLVQYSSSEDIRIATMLSETHIALLPVSRIRADAMALKDILNEKMKSSSGYLAFISGASRTADIERVLTIGVHGPQELHILLFRDAVASSA